MMRNKSGLVLIVVALLFVVAGWTAASQKQSGQRVLWEYTSVDNETRLNDLGAAGWELVAVTAACSKDGPCYMSFHLKRPK